MFTYLRRCSFLLALPLLCACPGTDSAPPAPEYVPDPFQPPDEREDAGGSTEAGSDAGTATPATGDGGTSTVDVAATGSLDSLVTRMRAVCPKLSPDKVYVQAAMRGAGQPGSELRGTYDIDARDLPCWFGNEPFIAGDGWVLEGYRKVYEREVVLPTWKMQGSAITWTFKAKVPADPPLFTAGPINAANFLTCGTTVFVFPDSKDIAISCSDGRYWDSTGASTTSGYVLAVGRDGLVLATPTHTSTYATEELGLYKAGQELGRYTFPPEMAPILLDARSSEEGFLLLMSSKIPFERQPTDAPEQLVFMGADGHFEVRGNYPPLPAEYFEFYKGGSTVPDGSWALDASGALYDHARREFTEPAKLQRGIVIRRTLGSPEAPGAAEVVWKDPDQVPTGELEGYASVRLTASYQWLHKTSWFEEN